jgi:hypothetical protein
MSSSRHSFRFPPLSFVASLLLLTVVACSRQATDPLVSGDADGTWGARPLAAIFGRDGAIVDHDYFPRTPGRASDFHVTLLGVGERDMRVVVGAPESFFERLATPWVYEAIPGLVPDTTFLDLRQYFSVAENGDLLFHGAQNKGVMSYVEPPVRVLPARPRGGETWRDTVTFRSYLPGVGLFDSSTVVFETTISERTLLRLPAGSIHAFRSQQVAIDVFRRPVAPDGGRRPEPPEILKGFWFARRRGIVARDYPSGPGPTNTNVRTYELTDQGWAAIPPPEPAP